MSHHDPKEGNDSIGTRIKTGFLSFRKKEGGGGGAPAAAGGTSDAEVQEMRAAMQKLKEQVQQLELEKALMRNLVDSVCGSGEDNSNEPKGAEGEDAEREKAKATMAEMCTKIAALTVSNGEHEERARKAEQKCAALEAALVHSRDELKEADSTGQKLRAQASDVAAMQAKIAALTSELQSSQTTIQQLMDRVSKTSNDKEQSARDYSLVLEKMTTQSDTLVKDLNERTEQLSKLNREIAFLRAENEKLRQESQDRERHQSAQQVVDRSLLKEAEERHMTIAQELKMHYEEELKSLQQATALALETEKSALEEQLARSKANQKVVVKELQEAHQKTLDEKETAWTAERDRIRNEFEEQHNDAVTKIMSDFETKEASLNDQIEALKVDIQRCKEEKDALDATIRGKEQRITELETEVNSLNDVADASEITIAEKDVMLNKLLRQVEALEEEKLQIASTQKGQVESLQREVEAGKAEKVALEAKLSGFDDHLAEVENEYKIKLKKNATVVKDLQQALAKLQEEGVRAATGAAAAAAAKPEPEQPHGAAEPVKEAHDDAPTATLQQENYRLIERLAKVQEELWQAQSEKQSYEEENAKLRTELDHKSAVVLAHFHDAVAAKNPSRFGSLFKSTKDQVQSEMQSMLESTLFDNMQLQSQVQRQARALDRFQQAMDTAVAAGFVLVEEESSEVIGGTAKDDKFE